MSTLEQAKAILETIRADLKREKEEVVVHLKDHRIVGWKTIDLNKNQALLAGIGIDPAVISATLVEYQQQARKIGKQISVWGNEVGNQLADLIGQLNPDLSLAAAQRLAEKSLGLSAMKEELFACTSRLVQADQRLRQHLTLKSMLAIAKILVTGKRDFFDGGMATLDLLMGNTVGQEGVRTLGDMCQEPARLEARFKRLDVSKLPRIVEEILFHYIEEAVVASKEVGVFLAALNGRMARELELIATIERDLNALSSENTAVLFDGISQQAAVAGNLISSLYHKRQIKESMATSNEVLELLNVFHLLLKNRIIPSLQKEVGKPGAALNPVTISVKMTHSFFMGAIGMIRSIKLMITSLTGKAAINESELQLTMEEGIRNCKVFYGKTHADLKKITLYIDTLIGQYPKPFPYNDLFKLTRTTLSAYGDEVEKFIHGYDVPKDLQTLAAVNTPAKVGKLTAAIIKHKKTFQKANAEAI